MTQTSVDPAILFRAPNWLLSDTEESVVGTEWHQEAIGALADMLRDIAARRGAGWGVCEQIALLGLRHEDGTSYDPRPDVMALRRPLPSGSLSSIRLADAGAPLFIAEVASASTKTNDQRDKKQAYAAIGASEYLVFDPDGDLLPRPILAWRLEAGAYVPWGPGADGWWHSTTLDVSFHPAHPFLRVRDRDGTIVELSGEVRRRARELEQRLTAEERARWDAVGSQRDSERALRNAKRAQQDAERAQQEEARQRAILEQRLAEAEDQLRLLRQRGDESIDG